MNTFIPGQRWISNAEPDLGLGTVMRVDHRTVQVVYLATGDTRVYAKESAPLSRASFSPGDKLPSHNGWTLSVTGVKEKDGLLVYTGTDENGQAAQLEESQLDNFIRLNRPLDRLLTGQLDQSKWFELRSATWQHYQQQTQTETFGLLGGRISLIPHQLYIAHEVATRFAPRVLLADEVGLGKTIEAGLIVHHQLLSERAKRVFIVVPEPLMHQWLVEMLRRFGLYFSIYDESRWEALQDEQDNPFHAEQLVLCSLEFLCSDEHIQNAALAGDWDLMVVDEAHHLQWDEEQPSVEYQTIEQLALTTKGLLLLTATPEQLGKESHFARLRLLDPNRFPSYEQFLHEQESYAPIAHAINGLLEEQLDEETLAQLQHTLKESDNRQELETLLSGTSTDEEKEQARQLLIDHLLDRHGTGRVFYRNTRAAIPGFPERNAYAYPLALPEAYLPLLDNETLTDKERLSPELAYENVSGTTSWTKFDPRVDWLIDQLKSLKPQKALVITQDVSTVLNLSEVLRVKAGIDAAIFHEHMSIVERDRAAAYFADPDSGSQVMLCSEIGSEGRNFQFLHQLIMFDLPYNPGLLEQRIGRLDRIGQTGPIEIHIPYIKGSSQEVMYRWYDEALDAFRHTSAAAHDVFVDAKPQLDELVGNYNFNESSLQSLIEESRQLHETLTQQLHEGRDKLLEYHSCRPGEAARLAEFAKEEEKYSNIKDYMEQVFDCFNVDMDEQSDDTTILYPGQSFQGNGFPMLNDEGMTITYERDIALAREEVQFVTWEHQMTRGVMDLVLNAENGNACLISLPGKEFKPGTLLFEGIYTLQLTTDRTLNAARYLPQTSLRIVANMAGQNVSTIVSVENIDHNLQDVPANTGRKIVKMQREEIKELAENADKLASQAMQDVMVKAEQNLQQALLEEAERLTALKHYNPNVRQEEIDYFQEQYERLSEALRHTQPRLDAVRLIITT